MITRQIELDMPTEEVHVLIADGDGWTRWMVDAAQVEVAPGEVGTVDDGGRQRDVHIGDVGDNRVSFDWWASDDPARGSTVELIVEPREIGVVLHIVETFPRRSALSASAALRWSRCFAFARA